ncbi:MAG: hypothetical protein OXD33_08490 [Rhodobacteraceae bacterium]|nr:hypothetical protein [Paracoccaceae bacterium]
MNVRNHPDPTVLAKDAFRGMRYALRRGAKLVVEGVPQQLPEHFETASSELLNSAENLAKRIDRIAEHVLGLQFDTQLFGPPSFATGLNTKSSDQRLSQDASNLFFALTLCAKHMQIPDLLVSETLCVQLIAEDASFDWPLGKQDTASLCSELCRRIILMNILGDPPGIPSQHNACRRIDIKNVAFATSLWVYLERGSYGDSEEDLIKMCCDVTLQRSTTLAEAEDAAVTELFRYALSVV